ncbi:hypothetical protein KR018_005269 [Drosophila ironensis]|nr:hypothetical protein KR018_005269 [Drosophila ironensis]
MFVSICSEMKTEDFEEMTEPTANDVDDAASHSDSEVSSVFSFSSGPNDEGFSDREDRPRAKRRLTYWEDMCRRPVDKGELSQEKLKAILKEEEIRKWKEMDSENMDQSDTESEEYSPTKHQAKLNQGLDFYEDRIHYQENHENNSYMVIKDDIVFAEYERAVRDLVGIVKVVPHHNKLEIFQLVYPMLGLAYLQMVAGDKVAKAIKFLDRYSVHLNDAFMSRVGKLRDITRLKDIPYKARKLLAGYEKVVLTMSEEAYRQLLFEIEEWPRSQQQRVLTHIHIQRYDDNEAPQQRPLLGRPHLEVVYWAAPEPLHKKDFSTRPYMRGRRKRRNESPPRRNIHYPPGDRIYMPIPKRMDLLHKKNDEKHRVKLDRDKLPSAYLYTAVTGEEQVLCANFSEAYTMLAVGTVSRLYVFTLKNAKLVQLKPADSLKELDIGMAGIDKGMLDPTKKFSRRSLTGHQGPVYGCCFNPEDRFLLSCSEDYTVRLWCLLSWKCIVIYTGHLAPVCHVVYAPMGYFFATASADGMGRIWSQDSKKPLRILEGHLADMTVCVFHPNRHYLASGSADCTVRLWDVVENSEVRLFRGHKQRVCSLIFSICGRYLVSGGDDGTVMVWDTVRERLVRYLDLHRTYINSLEICLDNKLLVVGGQDCQISVWDLERLIHDYMPPKASKKRKQPGAPKEQRRAAVTPTPTAGLLLCQFLTKGAPLYHLRFTRRNLLLAFCEGREDPRVTTPVNAKEQERKFDARNWLEFVDAIKLKAASKQLDSLSFPPSKKVCIELIY